MAAARGCGAAVGERADGRIGEDEGVVARDAAGILQRGDRAPVGNERIVAADDRTAALVIERADRAGVGHGPVAGDRAGIGDRAERAGGLIQDAKAVSNDHAGVGERGGRVRAGGDHPYAGTDAVDRAGGGHFDTVVITVDRPERVCGNRLLGRGHAGQNGRQRDQSERDEKPGQRHAHHGAFFSGRIQWEAKRAAREKGRVVAPLGEQAVYARPPPASMENSQMEPRTVRAE